VLIDASKEELNMRTTHIPNEYGQAYPDDTLADSSFEKDETDDLEEFPVLLPSHDVRDLIEEARKRGLSATRLARRLVRNFLRQSQGILSAGKISPSEGQSSR
jgi:hypothetical protein